RALRREIPHDVCDYYKRPPHTLPNQTTPCARQQNPPRLRVTLGPTCEPDQCDPEERPGGGRDPERREADDDGGRRLGCRGRRGEVRSDARAALLPTDRRVRGELERHRERGGDARLRPGEQ